MHNAFVVRRGERVGKRAGDLDDLLDRQPTFENAMVERLAFDEFHGEEVDVVAFLDRKNCDDMRMVERGDGASFALEAREALGVARHV